MSLSLKRVLDALDAAEETGGRFHSHAIFMSHPGSSMPHDRFQSFADFYPFYLSEHRTAACRRLHFFGTVLVIVLMGAALADWRLLVLLPIAGYGFAWFGHFMFERNKPASFTHPWYSLFADFVMFRDMLTGRIKF